MCYVGSSLKFDNEITSHSNCFTVELFWYFSAPISNMILSMIKSYNVLFLIINLGLGSSVIQVMSVYQVVLIFSWATQEKNRAHYMYDIWHLWELHMHVWYMALMRITYTCMIYGTYENYIYMYDIWHLWELLSRSLNVVILDFWSLVLNFYNLHSY